MSVVCEHNLSVVCEHNFQYLSEFLDYEFKDVLSLERNYRYGGQLTSRIRCGLI